MITDSTEFEKNAQPLDEQKPIHKIKYGIIVDSLEVIPGKVEEGDYLSTILIRHKIRYPLIDKIVRTAEPVYNFTKVIPNHRYAVIKRKDSLAKPIYFIYERNKIDFIAVDLRDSVYVYAGAKQVDSIRKKVSGAIETSLWNAMVDNGLNTNLALALSNVFGWTVDFFGIQKGDRFKAYYDELYVEGKYAGIGKVHAAWMNHYGRDYYAIHFIEDSIDGYYGIDGQNMKRNFLKTPLRFSRISSRFSHSRLHPVLKIRRPHHGIDYAAPVGTPVYAIGDGKVIHAAWKGQAGRLIKIKHEGSYISYYLHLSRFAKGIKNGASVKQGQVIGFVGSSGMSTGPHLDFRMYNGATPLNPLKLETKPLKPLNKKYMDSFNILKSQLLDTLKSIKIKSISKDSLSLSSSELP